MKVTAERTERGAVAVIMAICAVLIFSLCALAVDLGNAYARKRDLQTEADLAALAAAAKLPHTAVSEPQILAEVGAYAAANQTVGQSASTWNFTDSDPANGHVEFFTDNPNKLRVVTPPATVDFGLAGVMGFSTLDIRTSATAEVKSPGTTMPIYAASACSWGQRAVTNANACGGAGNYGTLRLSRDDGSTPAEAIPKNTALGVERQLEIYPNPAPAECSGEPEAVEDPNEPVNCVQTDPGYTTNAASRGFITGDANGPQPGTYKGKLAQKPTATGCDPNGGSSSRALPNFDGNRDYTINDDVLTCFLTNTTTTVADISGEIIGSTHRRSLSQEIFGSPRFLWIPILQVVPNNGASNRYSIVGFRAAFITGQASTASKANPNPGNTNGQNGVIVSSSGLTELRVTFINPDALPEYALVSPSMPYLGTGTRVITLVD